MSIFDALSSIVGKDPYKKNDRQAEDLRKQALDKYLGLSSPVIEDIVPEQYKNQGDIELQGITKPQDLQYSDINSSFDDVSSDPRLKDQQMAALGALSELANNGGMSAEDKANLARLQSETSQADKGRRDAILQNIHARGMGGSGMELLSQLQSSQAATDRQSQGSLDVAGMAQKRALEAMMNQGQMAGSIRNQDFGEQSQVAQAQDAIKKFNSSNAVSNNQFNANMGMETNKYNSGVSNQGIMTNASNRQDIANRNTGINNNAQIQNKITNPQQNFNNKLNIANGQAGALSGNAASIDANTARQSAKDDAQLNAVLQGGAAIYGAKK